MGGSSSTVKIPEADDKWMLPLAMAKQQAGGVALQARADLLKAQSQMPPAMQTFDSGNVSKQAAEFGLGGELKSREIEALTDPAAARMRQGLGEQVAEITDRKAVQKSMDEYANKIGIKSGYGTGLGAGTIGRSALFDATSEAGRQFALRNLQLQQGYLAQTPAPIGGLDPAAMIEAEMAAKAQNLGAIQRFQQGVMAGGQGLQQSTSDWINQNLGELQQINQVQQQNKRQREEAMYQNAVQNAASQNALQGQMIGTGGAIAGAAIGAAIII